MEKCLNCGKSVNSIHLSSSGLCMVCFESTANYAINILKKLEENKEERARFCKILNKKDIETAIEIAKGKIAGTPFAIWDASIHFDDKQQVRLSRAQAVKILTYDSSKKSAEIKGSKNSIYLTSFESCTCRDFSTRQLPCKHIYKLAIEYANIDPVFLST